MSHANIRLLFRLAASLLLGWSVAVHAALHDITFKHETVTAIIDAFEREGHAFIYAESVVRPNLKFTTEPDAGQPLDRLKQALTALRLRLVQQSNGTWLVLQDRSAPPERAPLMGRVLDAATGEPVPGVRVEIGGAVAFTDAAGRFEFDAEVGPLSVSHEAYEERTVDSRARLDAVLEIVLQPDAEPPIDEVIVTSSRYALRHEDLPDSYTLSGADLEAIPELGDDAIRAASHLPGMATVGLSAKPHIRGGLQDELLVLFNNVELLEPFHLKDFQSIFSSFNPSLIKSIDVYTGGFPARYGDRMSGVMDINPTDEHRRLGGELSVSFLTTSASAHGTVANGRGEWVASGRRGNLDIVTKQINESVGDPSYSDWYAQFRFELNPSTELDVGTIVYNDNIELRDFDTDGEVAESRYENTYTWLQLHRSWTRRLDSTTLISFGNIDHDRVGFLSDDEDEPDGANANVDDRREFKIAALAHDMTYMASKDLRLEFGVRINRLKGRYDYNATIVTGELAELLGLERDEVRDIRVRPNGQSGGAYVSARYRPLDWLTLEPGLRWDFQDFSARGSADQLSPRLSVKVDLTQQTHLRFSAGRFHQAEGIHELQIGDGVDTFQDPQHADHLIAGIDHRFGNSYWSLRSELFTKRYGNPKRRFENLFNPLVLLPELADDRIEVSPLEARARGVEATLRYRKPDVLDAWLSVTRSRVEDRFDGAWHPRAWDQSDTVSAGVIWNVRGWTLGTSIIWHPGWRTTALPDMLVEDAPPTLDRNGDRLDPYISWDARVARTWDWTRQSLTVFGEVTNLLTRKNVGGIEYDIDEAIEDSGQFVTENEVETLLPLVPSIGVRWRF